MAITRRFLNKFSTDRNFSIPLPFQWTVTIDDDNLPGAITNATGKINQQWKVASSSAWTDKLSDNILVAQEIQVPSESVEITSISQENRGAFMPGYGVTQRTDFLSRNVTINFLETEKDIETELFRPWIIALSVDGLLNQNLKSIITMKQYTRDGKVRKTYKFTGVYPTNTEGYTLNYGDQEFSVKTVTFGYTNYSVIVGSGGGANTPSGSQSNTSIGSTNNIPNTNGIFVNGVRVTGQAALDAQQRLNAARQRANDFRNQ